MTYQLWTAEKAVYATFSAVTNETARIEAFSDGVFAVAITLLIFQIRVPPHAPPGGLRLALVGLWPSYLAFLASFMTIGVMWLNHHRLFSLIAKKDDGMIVLNLLLLLVVTWLPFPTALAAEHLRGSHDDQQTAALVYAASLLAIAIVLNVLWRYARRVEAVGDHDNVGAITRQYCAGTIAIHRPLRHRVRQRRLLSREQRSLRALLRCAAVALAEAFSIAGAGGTPSDQPVIRRTTVPAPPTPCATGRRRPG